LFAGLSVEEADFFVSPADVAFGRRQDALHDGSYLCLASCEKQGFFGCGLRLRSE
jgi:hypothetical protein